MEQLALVKAAVVAGLKRNLGDRFAQFAYPPPVFLMMQGEFVAYDPEQNLLAARFPILESYLNPIGSMQGGMIAAAVDNTFGPLSALIAPPSFTREFEITYSKPAWPATGPIVVEARLVGREPRKLLLAADVRDRAGQRLARAKAVHWMIEDEAASQTVGA